MQLWLWGILALHLIRANAPQAIAQGAPFELELIHKFSDKARGLMEARVGDGKLEAWPRPATMHFYQILHEHDREQHRRRLSEGKELILARGMKTTKLADQFGWLYYTLVDIGTPNKTFLVALDTGSDLFWVPCQCKQCAPSSAPGYTYLEKFLNVYSPLESATSKPVNCSNNLCDLRSECTRETDQCPYAVQYLSTNTSTSGTLIEDVMYFHHGNVPQAPTIEVPITLGCGQVQTGIFLEGGAPDGLLGLGLGEISVPSSLAKAGLIQDSFSMCFASDFSGRVLFGDEGDSLQQTTPFLQSNKSYSIYAVGLENIFVGSEVMTLQSATVFDTGTTFTYFPPPVYEALTKAFHAQVPLQRIPEADLSVAFEFCYATSASGEILVPDLALKFSSGGDFPVPNPYILLANQNNNIAGFCLAILPSSDSIIGQNFMTGYKIVFDRQHSKLGWSPSNCKKMVDGHAPSLAPSVDSKLIAPASSAPLVSHPPNLTPWLPHPPTNPLKSMSSSTQPHTSLLCALLVGLIIINRIKSSRG